MKFITEKNVEQKQKMKNTSSSTLKLRISVGILLSIYCLTVCALIGSPWFPPIQSRSLNTEEQQALNLYLADSTVFVKDSIDYSKLCLSIKNRVDSLGKVKESNTIKASYKYKTELESIGYYESYETETKIDEDKMQACKKLDPEYIEACKTKAIYFVETLQQNSYGYTLAEKEDLRKQYVKDNVTEYKDSLRRSLYVPPKGIIKPQHPIRECRWYEPSSPEIEFGWIMLSLLSEILLLMGCLYSIIPTFASDSKKEWVFSGIFLFNGIMSIPLVIFSFKCLPVLILHVLYILLAIFLLNWSGRELKVPKDKEKGEGVCCCLLIIMFIIVFYVYCTLFY